MQWERLQIKLLSQSYFLKGRGQVKPPLNWVPLRVSPEDVCLLGFWATS